MALLHTDHDGYMIDETNGAVINTNERELLTYRKQVEQFLELRSMKDDFDAVRRELQELRQLLATR